MIWFYLIHWLLVIITYPISLLGLPVIDNYEDIVNSIGTILNSGYQIATLLFFNATAISVVRYIILAFSSYYIIAGIGYIVSYFKKGNSGD